MSQRFTFAILGAGGQGSMFSRWIREHSDCARVVAVADPDPVRRKRVADDHKLGNDAQYERWEELLAFYTSAGFSDERIWLYVATELSDDPEHEPDPGERIEIVPWPLADLDDAIDQCEDSKSLIALLWLATRRVLAF